MKNKINWHAPRYQDPKTSLVSWNVMVLGLRTSMRLEPQMWQALEEIALREKCTVGEICGLVKLRKPSNSSLTAAVRVFLMLYYRAAATEDGHLKAGHGDFEYMKSRSKSANITMTDPSAIDDLGTCN